MSLFRRRHAPSSTWGDEVFGLADLARSRGWQPIPGDDPLPSLSDTVHRLSWILYDRPYSTALYDTTSLEHETVFRDAYGGSVDGRQVVVTNAWTNIGPQQLVKLHEMMGIAVCAVELGTMSPIMIVQPRQLPSAGHFPKMTTGDAAFDDRFVVAVMPGIDPQIVSPEVRRLVMAHDDWAFVGDENWLACLSRGEYQSGDDVSHRLDEVLAVVAAFPESVLPTRVDHSVDDLLARIGELSGPEDAIPFLQQLSPADRQRLAQSKTPLASFADVTTPEDAFARFNALDMQQRLQVLGMFQQAEGDGH
ncbi:MAG TPA: hypothetical protein VEP49_00415 [Acidimicrobiia bacterium]|nr:hypothetical protein [Acidimicrobiia bacterium]